MSRLMSCVDAPTCTWADLEPVSRTVLKLRNYLALHTCVNSMVYIVKYLRKPTQDSLTPGFTKLA